MNPARSPTVTPILPRPRDQRLDGCERLRPVSTVWMTSTSFITGAGLKKCTPTTCSGPVGGDRDLGDRQGRGVRGEHGVGPADPVELREDPPLEVHALRHGLDDQVGSRRARRTRWTASIRSRIAPAAPRQSLPRCTARPVDFSRCPRPRSSASSSTSIADDGVPAPGNTSAIPAPIVPSPTTPTLLKSARHRSLHPAREIHSAGRTICSGIATVSQRDRLPQKPSVPPKSGQKGVE